MICQNMQMYGYALKIQFLIFTILFLMYNFASLGCHVYQYMFSQIFGYLKGFILLRYCLNSEFLINIVYFIRAVSTQKIYEILNRK